MLALMAGTAMAAPLALAGPVSAAEPGAYTVTPLTFTVDAGGRTCTVEADLYRPAGVDAGSPAPAVMATNGFGGSKADGQTDVLGKAFASRGYVGLVYSGLGFGKSGCLISLDDPRIDGQAAARLVDFLAGTRAADDGTRVDFVTKDGAGDPRVGMIGGSYGGAIQLAAASVDPRLDALVPLITWNDLAYALAPNGADRATPGVFKWQWANGFYLMGEAQPLLSPSLDPSRINSLHCLHFVTDACDTVRLLNSGSFPAAGTKKMLDYARSVSPASYLDGVKAPTLLVQGQMDTVFNLNEARATYEKLESQGVETKMVWQSWGHSGGLMNPDEGELDLAKGNLETSYVGRRILAWFDRYLHGNRNADTGAEFAYHRDWQSGYGTADTVPAVSQKLYLSGDGKLVDNTSKVARGSRTYSNALVPTSHSEISLAGMMGIPQPGPSDTAGTYVDWTSAPLTAPVDLVGSPKATLRVQSPVTEWFQDSGDAADKLVLFAKVYDIAPDGTKTLVKRLVAPVRVPDVKRPFTVELPAIVHRYEAGHRLQFVIAGSDSAYFGNRGIRPVTVTSAPDDAGTLELPLVNGRVG
ncbi:CocE/NonD family hydrolase [Streptomyces sp. NBC_01255]|uniref:CocE/NonD family hydrolase n=1 Tax=Streptomyces sp. NBC_01255 TaxID=2903798 RepID=UPI002E341FA8|nr:CocE/NonD family hydrolase [Streptomyces sp. NBC_01255]